MIDENVKNIKDILLIMIKAGAFDVKNGSVTLNFNSNGDLMNHSLKCTLQINTTFVDQHYHVNT